MRIVWDEPKRLANLNKHGLDFEEANNFDWSGAIIQPAKKNRYRAIGRLGRRAVAIVFQAMGTEAISVISMRPASKAERKLV